MAIPWLIIKHFCQKHTHYVIFLIILVLLTVVLYRYILLTLLAWSFLFGFSCAYSYISEDFLLPNVLFMYSRKKKKGAGTDDELTLMKSVCTVCGQRKCPRHRPELNILAFQPWTNLEIRKSVDDSLEEFLNIVLNEFVYTWYKNVSCDDEFVDELRGTFRFFASVILRRAKKIDVPSMVTEKILKAALQHLHAVLKSQESAPDGTDIQQATIEYLGANLHYAMSDRRTELEYIRRLVEKLFPYILPPQALQSRAMCSLIREILAGSLIMPAMDAIANPDMVNNIISILLDETPIAPPTDPPTELVPFLGNFSKQNCSSFSDPELPPKISKSTLRLVLGDVMDTEHTEMLYPFMQFLKKEAAVNVLQFALACESFNKQILNPDLSEADIVALHTSVKDMYSTYFSPNALDKIKFEENISTELQEIAEGPPEQVVRLRTSTPMFRAYEHVYNLLSYIFLPLFHQSDDYYTMICGERLASQIANRNSSRLQKKKDFGIATLGSKLKGVFKSSDSRTSLDIPEMENTDDADTITIASSSSLDDDLSAEEVEPGFHQIEPPDLSTWRVTIPRTGARPDPENRKKQFFVFIIDVRRVEVTNDPCGRFARRYSEFYVLEQKLTEFHGEFADCLLPPKKIMGTKNYDFIDGKREQFEQYLQKLFTRPHLKGSQLLYNFLSSELDFNTGFDINIGRMLKAVPMKLAKEKGQHLESFLQAFEKSTDAAKPKAGNMARRDSSASFQSTSSEKLRMSMFGNNSDGLDQRDEAVGDLHVDRTEIDGIYDTLIYIARYVFRVQDWCHHLLLTARMMVKPSLEAYLEWYIDLKVGHVTQEHRLVDLVHLLRDVLFFDTDSARTDEQKKERYDHTIKDCLNFAPNVIVSAIGQEKHEAGIKLILHALQQPKLNKQLSYVFLDIVITELFPELKS